MASFTLTNISSSALEVCFALSPREQQDEQTLACDTLDASRSMEIILLLPASLPDLKEGSKSQLALTTSKLQTFLANNISGTWREVQSTRKGKIDFLAPNVIELAHSSEADEKGRYV